MTLDVSRQTEARLTEEARRRGISVDALNRAAHERTASGLATKGAPEALTVFEQRTRPVQQSGRCRVD
jgi:hypothetical protein